ncbi:MAG: LysM peptidoglycan-binding domain-containing protein [Anaerolineae bacterium]
MKKSPVLQAIIGLSLLLALLGSLSTLAAAQEPQVRPTVQPRATATPVLPPGQPQGDTGASPAGGDNCASLKGTAINWGFGAQAGVGLHLHDGGWHVDQVTADDGHFDFGALGSGVGMLVVDPGALPLTPMVNQAAIRLTCNFPVQANIGLYSGPERPTPPAQLSLAVSPAAVLPGSTASLTMTVRNSLPNPISQVAVTNLFPGGLTIEGVQTSAGTAELLDGTMLTVFVGSVASGGHETVTVQLKAAETLLPGAALTDTATLFYAESAADQSHIAIAIGEAAAEAASAPLVAGAGTTVTHVIQEGDILYDLAPRYGTTVEAIMAANNITNPRRLKVGQALVIPSAAAAPQVADTAAEGPAPDVLPVTGLGVSLSLAGVLLALIVLLSRGARSVKRGRE